MLTTASQPIMSLSVVVSLWINKELSWNSLRELLATLSGIGMCGWFSAVLAAANKALDTLAVWGESE